MLPWQLAIGILSQQDIWNLAMVCCGIVISKYVNQLCIACVLYLAGSSAGFSVVYCSTLSRRIAAVAIAICRLSVSCDTPLALTRYQAVAMRSSILPLAQGAGGMVMIDPAFQRAMAQHCQEHNIPVILDEVFSGIWRLGHLSAAEMLGIKPDIACYAKLLTGKAAAVVSAWPLVSYMEMHNVVVTAMKRFLLVADAHNIFDLSQTLPHHVHDVCVVYSFKLAVRRWPF